MKILKHGKYYKNSVKTQCVCGCEFEYEIKDIELDCSLEAYTCPSQVRNYVQCPECGARTYLGTTYDNHIPHID